MRVSIGLKKILLFEIIDRLSNILFINIGVIDYYNNIQYLIELVGVLKANYIIH